jgi:hypothetical protein
MATITIGPGITLGPGITIENPQIDWSKYLIIPVNQTAAATPNKLVFYNVPNNTADFTISASSFSGQLTRVMDKLVVSDANNVCKVYDIQTQSLIQTFNGNQPLNSAGVPGDIVKISTTEIAFVYKYSLNVYASIWKLSNGTFTNTYNSSISNFWGENGIGYDSPAACSFVTLDNSNAQFSSYSGYVAIAGIYNSSTNVTRLGMFSLSNTGEFSVISSYTSNPGAINYSRPGAASGTNNYGQVGQFDGLYVSTMTGGSAIPTPTRDSNDAYMYEMNIDPCGVANSTNPNVFVAYTHNFVNTASFKAWKNGQITTLWSGYQAFNNGNGIRGGAMQMYGGGMYMMLNGEINFYNGTTTGGATSLPSSVIGTGSGFINAGGAVRRIYNF